MFWQATHNLIMAAAPCMLAKYIDDSDAPVGDELSKDLY